MKSTKKNTQKKTKAKKNCFFTALILTHALEVMNVKICNRTRNPDFDVKIVTPTKF